MILLAAALKTDNLQTLADWLARIALAVCVGGILISCALWAIGSKGQNPGQELTGKRGIVLCITAAFFIGILPQMIDYFETLAAREDQTGVTGSQGNACSYADRAAGRC